MKVLITGGAGFIGCNIAARHLKGKDEVVILDNLSRKGTEKNLSWLKTLGSFTFVRGDIRNYRVFTSLFKKHKFNLVYHMAAQVAVTTSVIDPVEDFQINILGTLNLLEAMRRSASCAVLLFASTNKVYGGLEDIRLLEGKDRYRFAGNMKGVTEERLLDFHSPYGCSKGAADQYVRDYSRIYGLRTVVFRQSCIYGRRQFGVEDQGWVAHFIIRSIFGKPLKIYGDGKQVRDILFVDDLVNAYEYAYKNTKVSCGKIYNVGGGFKNQLSLRGLIVLIEKKLGRKIKYTFSDWRPGDQKIYVSDNSKLTKELKWNPEIDVNKGINLLMDWVESNKNIF